jgi:hypothetical protein
MSATPAPGPGSTGPKRWRSCKPRPIRTEGFDAVVIGEFERAFAAGQARSIIAQLHDYHLDVWLPEFGGPVDLTNTTHQALLQLLGHQAEREVLRARHRTTRAMAAQVRTRSWNATRVSGRSYGCTRSSKWSRWRQSPGT